MCLGPAPFATFRAYATGPDLFVRLSKPAIARFQRETKAESLLPSGIFGPLQAMGDVGRARFLARQPLQRADVTAGPRPPLHRSAPLIEEKRKLTAVWESLQSPRRGALI